jgi:methylenetetrahydrofolate dehydrogenase (NADP+) / methenyltetrahydrofolate cyclohydrolase
MSAKIIDGKAVAARIRADLKTHIMRLAAKDKQPGLAVIIAGDNPSSRKYVNMKKKACAELGIYSEEHTLPEDITQTGLIRLVDDLNNNPKIDGILVQLPLPGHLNEQQVIERISPSKDVDGFHPINVGKLLIGIPGFLSCTPAGVMELIKETGIGIAGKECVVVGRSNIVGKPQAIMLLREHGTVTICHSRTPNLAEVCGRGDILIAAVGKAGLITGDMIKPGAVVIDVGTSVNSEGKLVGDVHFESAVKVAGWITPVPGGVGPMTIAMLMKNTIMSAENLQ